MQVTAIIVARSGSVRLKNKSMLQLGSETLISRKIRQLRACKNIDRVVFGSDSALMLHHAESCGAEVVERPAYFCDERLASANDMIGNMCELIATDIVVWAHCTNPFISTATYDRAVETFLGLSDNYDSLISVIEFQEHLWNEQKTPLNYNPYAKRHIPAKELPMYYMQDGGIFIQPYTQMKSNSYFFGKKPYLFVVPSDEFLDINTMRDYIVAKALYAKWGGVARSHKLYSFIYSILYYSLKFLFSLFTQFCYFFVCAFINHITKTSILIMKYVIHNLTHRILLQIFYMETCRVGSTKE